VCDHRQHTLASSCALTTRRRRHSALQMYCATTAALLNARTSVWPICRCCTSSADSDSCSLTTSLSASTAFSTRSLLRCVCPGDWCTIIGGTHLPVVVLSPEMRQTSRCFAGVQSLPDLAPPALHFLAAAARRPRLSRRASLYSPLHSTGSFMEPLMQWNTDLSIIARLEHSDPALFCRR
jgi:hypothetical protein